jgi:hypothetical protein
MITNREIFDRVEKHLLAQNARAMEVSTKEMMDYPACLYLARDGKKCAVGCLITAEHYSPMIEGLNISLSRDAADAVAKSLGLDKISEPLMDMLVRLQRVHDQVLPDEWAGALQKLRAKLEEEGRL